MKRITLALLLVLVLIGLTNCNSNQEITKWSKLFEKNNVTGTFVLKNLGTGKTLVYNRERSKKGFVPASTFKILNSMIALQTSSIASVDDTIKWDGVVRDYDKWNKDHTMRTAFPVSCVWFYQELARRIGKEKMQKWVTNSNYGNKNIEDKIDSFWLDGKLAISATEQIEFLEKLVNNDLPFDKSIIATVKEIMITDSTDHYVIHSKTGWSMNIGWNVGYINTKNNVWVFALNIDLNDIKMANKRKMLTYDILKEQNIID